LDAENHCVSIPWIVLLSLDHIWIQISSIATGRLRNLTGSRRNRSKMAREASTRSHCRSALPIVWNQFDWELSHVLNLMKNMTYSF
jgi:hypothetical protein